MDAFLTLLLHKDPDELTGCLYPV